jgi:hypothetical protein
LLTLNTFDYDEKFSILNFQLSVRRHSYGFVGWYSVGNAYAARNIFGVAIQAGSLNNLASSHSTRRGAHRFAGQ